MSKDRTYLIRVMDSEGESEYFPVTEFNIERYQCGLVAGDKLRLKHDIIVRDAEGEPTGDVHEAGGIWEVLTGAEADPEVLWLKQPDGEYHSWDDDPTVFEMFERVAPEAVG